MTKVVGQKVPHRQGINARAIEMMMAMLEFDKDGIPTLDAIAAEIAVAPADLRAVFDTEEALLNAAAEEGVVRLADQCVRAVVAVDPNDAFGQCIAFGRAYLDWAFQNPRHFRLLSNRDLAPALPGSIVQRYNDAMHDLLQSMLKRSVDNGELHPQTDVDMLMLLSRSQVYGLARMVLDGHMIEWGYGDQPQETAYRALDHFVQIVARAQTVRPSAAE